MEKKGLVLCDTNILIELYKNNEEIIKSLRSIGQANMAISIVTTGELLYGALNKKELNRIKKDLAQLIPFGISSPVSEVFTELMIKYTLSHKLSLGDGLIAATAIAEDLPLYTLNLKDFKFIEGLRLWGI
ncbi:type II toxin-antitoxin system VapC family toxin [Reichenbachiella agarivorans]|uniref:Type II toxin-antitoxin system VapC family toxin n=1 Tax=Reichenbachiella agarivorans TaxID=2979464 RepID=A0ABY6CT23_9BACT|nr:type II toxin-antitoxin system VapC family toxin [Reichenbachiella agarivorans]UXP33669.1 type II toxin-antitoxin system VapC family toxin [Reichenbachiella agarivorans]